MDMKKHFKNINKGLDSIERLVTNPFNREYV